MSDEQHPVISFALESRGDSAGENVEVKNLVKKTLTEEQRRFQLALTRLVLDTNERRQAEFNGFDFQAKYDLSNEQMVALAAVAIMSGEINPGPEIEQIKKDLAETHGTAVGSCSCSCP